MLLEGGQRIRLQRRRGSLARRDCGWLAPWGRGRRSALSSLVLRPLRGELPRGSWIKCGILLRIPGEWDVPFLARAAVRLYTMLADNLHARCRRYAERH